MRGALKTFIITILLVTGLAANARAERLNDAKPKPASPLAQASSKLVDAANQYKKSVETLIPIYESAVASATEALEKRKELFAKGLISKQELDSGEQALKQAKATLDQARGQIADTDHVIAEAAEEEKVSRPNVANPKGYTTRNAIMRYDGGGGWNLAQAVQVQGFFASKFGQQLPISAYGQTATHNRLGFDHRNSVDVAVHPDSSAGIELMTYLRANGIPFLAFRSAVPGSATGAHIHIGYPSHRK